MKILFALLSILIALPVLAAEQFESEQAALRHCPNDTVAWLNRLNGKLHPKGTKWYGNTRSGAYVCQKERAESVNKIAGTATSAADSKAGAVPKPSQPIPSTTSSNWHKIMDDGIRTVYAAPTPQERKGSKVTMLALVDLRQASALSDGKQFLSWETQYEFDCDKKLYRIVAASMYSGNMGEGEVTGSVVYDSPALPPIPVGSNGELLWQVACGKR